MKACAKKNSVSTPELLEMVKDKATSSSSENGVHTKKQVTGDLRAFLRSPDADFKKPPVPRRRKRKNNSSNELR